MPASLRRVLIGAIVALGLASPAFATEPSAFSGAWALDEARSAPAAEGADVPLESVVNARRLVVEDDGRTLRVTYPSGRRRVLATDGVERELDDGDGPAKVIARRRGNVVLVSSKWSRERALEERWEARDAPRGLVVTGKTGGRTTARYRRVYGPAPPATPTPAVTPTPSPSASAPRYATPAPAPSPGAAGPAACSIRPPKGTGRAELARLAKISSAEAEKRAVESVAPRKVSSVISSSVEVEDGCLAWPFALRTGDGGLLEVSIDAGDGKVLYSGLPRD